MAIAAQLEYRKYRVLPWWQVLPLSDLRSEESPMPLRYLVFFVAVGLASAQGSLSGPSVGFFFDSQAEALRRIWGIPGSAVAGENLDLGFPAIQANFSPAQDYALVVAGDGSVNLVLLGPTGFSPQLVAALPPLPDRIAISPGGHAAAFTYGTSVRILTGLPKSLDRIEASDISALPGAPAALAISDDGAVLLVSVPGNAQTSSAGGVFVFSRGDSGPRLVAPTAASDLSFLPDSHDALITAETSNSVTALQDVGGTATSQWTFADDRLPAPNSARASLDGQRILLASAKNNLVVLLDRNGNNPVFVPCSCSPDRTGPLSKFVYQLTDPGSGLLWILDLSLDPRLYFVPVAPLSGDSQ
jgi:hypothetical protein